MTTHHTDWIHKYRKYKSKYFELKQSMGLYNQSGGAAPITPAKKGAVEDGKPAKKEAVEDGKPVKKEATEDGKPVKKEATEDGKPVKKGETKDGKAMTTTPATKEAKEEETKGTDGKGEAIKNLITIKAMNGAQPTCGKISPGGLFILVGYSNGQCCIYRMSTGEMILNEPFQTQCSKINDVDWAEGSMLFVVGGDIDESFEPSQKSTMI